MYPKEYKEWQDEILSKLVRAYTRERPDGSIAVYGITDDCQKFVLNCRELYRKRRNFFCSIRV